MDFRQNAVSELKDAFEAVAAGTPIDENHVERIVNSIVEAAVEETLNGLSARINRTHWTDRRPEE